MAMEVGRGLTLPLLVLNFCLYLIAACLAGWALNKNIDSSIGSSYYVGRIFLPHPFILSSSGSKFALKLCLEIPKLLACRGFLFYFCVRTGVT